MNRRKLPILFASLGFIVLTGCSTPSVITLNDGSQIQTVDTPAFDEDSGFYEFEQLDGKHAKINKDQVITVKEL